MRSFRRSSSRGVVVVEREVLGGPAAAGEGGGAEGGRGPRGGCGLGRLAPPPRLTRGPTPERVPSTAHHSEQPEIGKARNSRFDLIK